MSQELLLTAKERNYVVKLFAHSLQKIDNCTTPTPYEIYVLHTM